MPNFFINVKEKGAKKAEKNIRGLNSSLGGLASKAALAAGGFFGAQMLLSGMKSAIDLAGKQEAAEKALETALGRRSEALLGQATALQAVSTFGDEAIIQQQAFLGSLKFSEDQIKSIIPVAMDLAAATGMTLESAVRNTAKTFSGLAGELGELVPQLRGLTKEQMMAGDAVTVMADLFGGQASAQTETMAGKLEQLGNTLGDTAEAFGELLFPIVMPLADGLKLIGESAVFVMNAFKSMITEKEVEILDNYDIKTKEFKDNLDELNTVQLITLAQRMQDTNMVLQTGSEASFIYSENIIALNEAIANNTEIQSAMNAQITEMSVRHSTLTIPTIEKIAAGEMSIAKAIEISRKAREAATREELKGYALTSGSARDAMIGIVKAEAMEASAGLIASIFKNVPFPLSAVLAAGAGATVSAVFDRNVKAHVPAFAQGGSFETSGPQLFMAGDNFGGRERIDVTPLSSMGTENTQVGNTVNVSVSGNVMSQDFVEGELAEAIRDAARRGTDFGVG